MKKPFLFGEFELSVDAKNRIIIPSEIRRSINPETDGDAFFVTLRNKVPWLYPERYYEFLANEQVPSDITPTDEMVAFARLTFALAKRVEWDSQGRLVMPDALLVRAELGKEVTLIGMRDHLELWNRPNWESERERLYAESLSIESRATASLLNKSVDRP